MFISSVTMSSTTLDSIPGLDSNGVGLLQAVGVEGCGILSRSDPSALLEEMERANEHLELVDRLPELDDLVGWIEAAQEIDGIEEPLVTRLEREVELVPIEVGQAFPIPAENIVRNNIAVSDVPAMTEFLAKDDLVEERLVEAGPSRPVGVPVREIAPKAFPGIEEGDKDAIAVSSEKAEVAPLKSIRRKDIRTTASPELNAGKKLLSRRYIRGVLHPQPFRVKIGAVISLLTLVLLPLNFVAGGLALTVFKEWPLELKFWLLLLPGLFFFFGFLYLTISRTVTCRVCGQPVFSQKACRRNPKAHHIPLLGHIIPTSIHLWIFHWFRCMYCGTSVRLKE